MVKRGIEFAFNKRQIDEEALLDLTQVTYLTEVEVTSENTSAKFNNGGTDWASWWWPCLWIFIVKTYLKAEYSNEI